MSQHSCSSFRLLGRALLAAVCLLLAASASFAQEPPPGPIFYVYVVNFECGFQVSDIGAGGYEPMVKVANYASKVDIHNYDVHQANVQAEVFSTGNSRWSATAGPLALPSTTMNSNTSTVIDCNHVATAINGSLPPGKPFYTGMLRIVSDQELVVWATKTTQVCAGLAKLDDGDPIVPPIGYDIGSGFFYSTGSGATETADLSLFGCPAAEIDGGTGGTPNPPTIPGTFRGPGGAVPPGLRPIPGVTSTPTPLPSGGTSPGGFTLSNVSVSHSMDFERVEGVCIND